MKSSSAWLLRINVVIIFLLSMFLVNVTVVNASASYTENKKDYSQKHIKKLMENGNYSPPSRACPAKAI